MSFTFPCVFTCLVIALSTQTNAQQAPYSDPDNTGGWVLNEAVSDEFKAVNCVR